MWTRDHQRKTAVSDVVIVTCKNRKPFTHGIRGQRRYQWNGTFLSHDEFIEKTRLSGKGHKL
jgi:hypothetical protein